MTRLDTDPTNYVYTITYLPDNIDNGTAVTVSGSSIYAGVSKSFAFSFTGTKKSTIYYVTKSSYTFLWSDEGTYKTYGVAIHSSNMSQFNVPNTQMVTIPITQIITDASGVGHVTVTLITQNPKINAISFINSAGKVTMTTVDISGDSDDTSGDIKIINSTMYLITWGKYYDSGLKGLRWKAQYSDEITKDNWKIVNDIPSDSNLYWF